MLCADTTNFQVYRSNSVTLPVTVGAFLFNYKIVGSVCPDAEIMAQQHSAAQSQLSYS